MRIQIHILPFLLIIIITSSRIRHRKMQIFSMEFSLSNARRAQTVGIIFQLISIEIRISHAILWHVECSFIVFICCYHRDRAALHVFFISHSMLSAFFVSFVEQFGISPAIIACVNIVASFLLLDNVEHSYGCYCQVFASTIMSDSHRMQSGSK